MFIKRRNHDHSSLYHGIGSLSLLAVQSIGNIVKQWLSRLLQKSYFNTNREFQWGRVSCYDVVEWHQSSSIKILHFKWIHADNLNKTAWYRCGQTNITRYYMHHLSTVNTRAWLHAVIDPIHFLRNMYTCILKEIVKSLLMLAERCVNFIHVMMSKYCGAMVVYGVFFRSRWCVDTILQSVLQMC